MSIISVSGVKYKKILKPDLIKQLPLYLPNATIDFSTGHWSAGRYNQPFSDYQSNIASDYLLITQHSPNDRDTFSHTWRRNSFNFGFSFMAMYNKDYPVTKDMIENAAILCACMKVKYNLAWTQFKDHYFWACMDGYSDQRWDVHLIYKDQEAIKAGKPQGETLMERIIRKANWYYVTYFKK